MIDFKSVLWIIRVRLADTNNDNPSQLWSLTAKRTGCDNL
ncbi:glycine cleavage system protein H [Escherichia phage IMM-002]|uniref:Glycine cleavage system protein H n=1 Tax=Escherichia phage IMM-002 TaxID=2041760 RepID=A0A384WIA9_9CAUD|nr:glycine cleavage system protein H [Escherichia phage IMM-002]ATI16961.1 glycine cleavage system protein H [Escherichia phage IMM-002]